MAITVWHRTDSFFGLIPQPMEPQLFEREAELATDDLEEAFTWSQHQDEASWDTHPTRVLRAYAVGPVRSTSVGDILECHPSGMCWSVAHRGFREELTLHFPPAAPDRPSHP